MIRLVHQPLRNKGGPCCCPVSATPKSEKASWWFTACHLVHTDYFKGPPALYKPIMLTVATSTSSATTKSSRTTAAAIYTAWVASAVDVQHVSGHASLLPSLDRLVIYGHQPRIRSTALDPMLKADFDLHRLTIFGFDGPFKFCKHSVSISILLHLTDLFVAGM